MVVKDKEFKVHAPIPLGWLWMVLFITGFATAFYYAHNNPIVGGFALGIGVATIIYFFAYLFYNILLGSVYWYNDAKGEWHAIYDVFPKNAPGLIFEIPVAGWGNRLRVYYNGEARWTVNTGGWRSSGKNPGLERSLLDALSDKKSGDIHAALISPWVRDCRFVSIDNGTAVLCRVNGRTFLYHDGDALTEALALGPEKEAEAKEAWKAMQTELLKTIDALKLGGVLGDDPPRVLARILDWLIVLYPHAANVIGEKTGIPGNEVIYKLCGRIRELEAAPVKLQAMLIALIQFVHGPGRAKEALRRPKSNMLVYAWLIVMAWETLPEIERTKLHITDAMYNEARRTLAMAPPRNGKHATPPTAAEAATAGQGGGQV